MTVTLDRSTAVAAETVFSHPRVTVTEVPFRGGRHVIVNQGTGLGAVIVPVSRHRGMIRIGFTAQHRPAVGCESLELPRGGTRDLSDDEAVRELAEELGIGEPAAVRRFGSIRPDTGLLSTEVGVWVASIDHRQAEDAADHVDPESGGTVQWLDPGEVMGLIHSGRIRCGITLAALLVAQVEGILSQEL